MTGPEHYREAEDCITIAAGAESGSVSEAFHLQLGQLHATLALTAATAVSVVLQLPISSDISKPWVQALGLPDGGAA